MHLAETVGTYSEAWAADDAERRRLLEVAWHEDGVYSDPVGRADGREALVSHIAGFQEQFPDHRIVVTSGVDEHDGCFRFAWALSDADGDVVMEGVDFGEVADDGRIARIVGFFDPLPEAGPVDRMRRTGVGIEDVNIVGTPGPTGIPPGEEADGGLLVDDPEGARRAET
jgi:hypothetical protein